MIKPDVLNILKEDDGTSRINEYLGELLRNQMQKLNVDLTVDAGDIAISTSIPDQSYEEGDCKYKFHFHNLKADGKIKHSSNMAATINLFKEKAPVMLLESKIDAGLSLSGSLRGSRHKKVFKKCIQLARKTIGLDVNSHGEVAIGVMLKAQNFAISKLSWRSYEVSFDFGLELEGKVINWDISSVNASKCNIKLFGIKILSFCSYLERKISEAAKKYITNVVPIQAPKLIEKLESKLRTKIGEKIIVPLYMPWF